MTDIKDNNVIYFGDSIYADLQAAKRQHNWKTVAIVSEIDDEIDKMNSNRYQSAFFVHKITEIALREIQYYLNDHKLINKEWKLVIDELEKIIELYANEKNDVMNP